MALAIGDIAFVQFNASTTDQFSFVAVKLVAAGEVINFTDNGWKSTGGFRTGEGVLTYTVPDGGLQPGTVIKWVNGGPNPSGFSSNNPTNFAFNASGDSLIAYQGELTAPTVLIAAIQTTGTKGNGNWDDDATSTATSALPGVGNESLVDLTDGTYSVSLVNPNDYYSGSQSVTSADALATINNEAYWTGSGTIQPVQNYSFTALCYLAGTHIHTPSGERRIETLAIGDEITTIDGTQRLRWIGRHSYPRAVAGPWVSPIRISTDAFGQGLPHRDLLVSPWHAILLGDVLVRAADLVNGSTITQIFPGLVAHYLNLEFDAPTVVYAEGVAAETYANHANRHMFENAAEYTALYGDDARVMIDAAGNNLRRFPIVFDGPRFQDALRRANAHRRYA